jgi:hypothetical protein
LSDWVNLTKNEKYYIKGRHYDGGGGDHYSVGVEINKTETMNIANHQHNMKEIQYISAGPKHAKTEITRVTITNPTKGGTYMLSFQNPKDLKYTLVEDIKVESTAS